jgi:hypothetical protein
MLFAQRVMVFAIRGAPRPWPKGRVLAWTSAEEAGHAATGAGRFPRLVIGSVKVCVVGAGLVKVYVSVWCGDAVHVAGSSMRRGDIAVYVRIESGSRLHWRDNHARD